MTLQELTEILTEVSKDAPLSSPILIFDENGTSYVIEAIKLRDDKIIVSLELDE